MLISKLRAGVLCLVTPQGTRYIRPSFPQRLALLWLFRHFSNVPYVVLNRTQTDMIDTLRSDGQFVYVGQETMDVVLLGTIEYPDRRRELPEKKVPQRAIAAAASATGSFLATPNPRAAQER